MSPQDTPLVYTTKGNIPASELELRVGWDISEKAIVFIEQYWYQGELVRESKHVKLLQGTDLDATQHQF